MCVLVIVVTDIANVRVTFMELLNIYKFNGSVSEKDKRLLLSRKPRQGNFGLCLNNLIIDIVHVPRCILFAAIVKTLLKI